MNEIFARFRIPVINLLIPGIGEATIVVLRRLPWKLLVRKELREYRALAHLIRLAKEKEVPVEDYPLRHYKACGLIQRLADT